MAVADHWSMSSRMRRRAQRPTGQADLDPARAGAMIALGRAAQQALAQGQFAVVSGQLLAVQRGHAGVERDVCDPPERQQVR